MFTSKLEEVLLSWQLSLKDKEETVFKEPIDLSGEWKSVSQDISFAGFMKLTTKSVDYIS